MSAVILYLNFLSWCLHFLVCYRTYTIIEHKDYMDGQPKNIMPQAPKSGGIKESCQMESYIMTILLKMICYITENTFQFNDCSTVFITASGERFEHILTLSLLISSLRPGDPHIHQLTRPSLIHIIACCLFSTRPLFESMITCCQLWTNCREIWLKLHKISFSETNLTMSFVKW